MILIARRFGERADAIRRQLAAVDEDLLRALGEWDAALDANDAAAKDKQKKQWWRLLDRRSYMRNLVREVDSVLSPQMTGVAKANI